MSEENVEIIRKGLEAFSEGDIEGSIADFAPEFEYIPSGALPDAQGAYRGPEGWKRFMDSFWGEFDEVRAETHDLIPSGDHVVAVQTLHARGKQSGAETTWDLWQVWTLRDGKTVRGQGFITESEALEAAGLSE